MVDCVFFLDTTSQNNWGCHSTTYFTKQKLTNLGYNIKFNMTLHQSLVLSNVVELTKKIKKNNIKYVFINGEGALYEQHDIKGKNMIKFILLLNSFDCKIFLINSCFDLKSRDNITNFKKCLTENFNFHIREPVSLKKFNSFFPNFETVFQPDYLYLIYKQLDQYQEESYLSPLNLVKKNYIVIGGNSNYYRSDRKPYDAISVYTKMIDLIKKNTDKELVLYASSEEEINWLNTISRKTNIKYFHVKKVNWRKAFVLLSNAYLSISGRYHPTIMSIIGLTPSLMFSANHCKMNGVNEMFFENQNVINSHEIHNNFDYIIDFIKQEPKKYNNTSDNIKLKLEKYYKIVDEIKFI